jgi:TolB-like protein
LPTPIGLPPWTLTLVIWLAVLGFPLACVLAWGFDVTPTGIERTAAKASSADAPPQSGEGARETTPSVSILPFTDMSQAQDQAYFCDGIAEEIINALCCVRGLRIASRTSSFQFKARAVDVREIGQQLNVGAVLEGSVRKAGNRVRITAQLLNTSDGYYVWSQSYDRDLDDVFAIQTDMQRRRCSAVRSSMIQRSRRRTRAWHPNRAATRTPTGTSRSQSGSTPSRISRTTLTDGIASLRADWTRRPSFFGLPRSWHRRSTRHSGCWPGSFNSWVTRNSSTRSCGKVCTRSSGTGRPDRAIELLGIAAEHGGAPLIPSLQRDGRAPSCAVRILGLSGFRQAGCVLIVRVWS